MRVQGRSYRRIFAEFSGGSLRAIFCIFHTFIFFFQSVVLTAYVFQLYIKIYILECEEAFPTILPSAKFPKIGNVPCFFCFSWGKKKEENLEKSVR